MNRGTQALLAMRQMKEFFEPECNQFLAQIRTIPPGQRREALIQFAQNVAHQLAEELIIPPTMFPMDIAKMPVDATWGMVRAYHIIREFGQKVVEIPAEYCPLTEGEAKQLWSNIELPWFPVAAIHQVYVPDRDGKPVYVTLGMLRDLMYDILNHIQGKDTPWLLGKYPKYLS